MLDSYKKREYQGGQEWRAACLQARQGEASPTESFKGLIRRTANTRMTPDKGLDWPREGAGAPIVRFYVTASR